MLNENLNVKQCLLFRSLRGVHPDFFVQLDFEIAVEQQTRACDRTFERVPNYGCPRDSLITLRGGGGVVDSCLG